jgi:MoaA/NifB/PqqE/SkfB family radical SAM enzyme
MAGNSIRVSEVITAWGSILRGRKPILSIEITRECPLRCPACYAYELGHLGAAGPLRQLGDFQGEALINGFLALVRRLRPMHVSIVGGEPLVRYRELEILLAKLEQMGIHVQLVTSAVRPIPASWRELRNFQLVVSVDGLSEEHDRRRSPATYDRILKHIAGHRITVHCTITRQLLKRPDYLTDFAAFWSEREEAYKIWFSLYTPQEGDQSEERLTGEDRIAVVRELVRLRLQFRKVEATDGMLKVFLEPPHSPAECIFSRVTACVSADLSTRITPCQFGGHPVCSECGCIASAGFASIGRVKVGGLIPASSIFSLSQRLGERLDAGERSVGEPQ